MPREFSASQFAPFDHASRETYTPQPSPDPAFTTFAQLAAIRLGTQRALLTLFDRTHQHILAEGTPSLSLVGGAPENECDKMLLGSCLLPKERGLCHHVESLPISACMQGGESVEGGAMVVGDVKNDSRIKSSELLSILSNVRFFAAVPLISPRGLTVGCLSVMDDEVKTSTLPEHSIRFMKDLASTIMKHLVMGHFTHKSCQAERMLVGLGSFNEGKSTLRHAWEEENALDRSDDAKEGQANSQQQRIQGNQETKSTELVSRGPNRAENPTEMGKEESGWSPDTSQKSGIEDSPQGDSIRRVIIHDSPQEEMHAKGIMQAFSRAANLIRESIGTEGVIFLDAQSDRFRRKDDQSGHRMSDPGLSSDPSSSGESTDSSSPLKHDSTPTSSDAEEDTSPLSLCLGFSNSSGSSINNDTMTGPPSMVHEALFTSLLRRYPRGKIFTYDANKAVSDESDSSTRKTPGVEPTFKPYPRRPSSNKKSSSSFQKDAKNLIKIFPQARSILLLPIWDSDKRRCFAGILVWTNNPELVFTFENELMYVSAFANSIMAEINRLDVEMADKAKTRLLSSITHELRTPLHGILGTADILSDTAMNALQHGMVHTVESCGRTLLDTINNLLDLAFLGQNRNHSRKKPGDKHLPASEEGSRERSKKRGEKTASSHVKLDAVLEEVAESVFAGYSFYNHPKMRPPALTDSSSRSAGQTSGSNQVGPRASEVTVIFDIQPDTEWAFNTHPGAWRRILMNIFGNALKYTKSGYIYIGLKSSEATEHRGGKLLTPDSSEDQEAKFEVTLVVKDTGKGIGSEYLQTDLFKPFMQEDSLMSGSGLGLSIVHQAVGSLGGSVEINSSQGVGTELSIHTPLVRSLGHSDDVSSNSEFQSILRLTQGQTIGFLGFGSSLKSQRDKSLYESLERLCHRWFGLTVTNVSCSQGEPLLLDFYLAVQTELDSEDVGGRDIFALGKSLHDTDGNGSPVVVICQSPEEAHHMFVTTQNRGEASVFEFISQPCGPRKLARALKICIKRQRDSSSGRSSPAGSTRWVELPESSHLPVDLESTDPPAERMKLSKRPTMETMGSREQMQGRCLNHRSLDELAQKSPQMTSPTNGVNGLNGGHEEPDSCRPFVLLVDDNDLNLQLLCAYTKKTTYEHMTARNGAEAVDVYKAHPDLFRVIILGMFHISSDRFATNTNMTRYLNAHHGRLRSRPPNPCL